MKEEKPIRIVLVNDHAIVREGYRSLLSKQAGMKLVGEASDGLEAYRLFKDTEPDITVMDLSLPGQGGLETIARIRQRNRMAKILVFSMHQNPRFAFQALRAGASGYVTKRSSPEVLIQAIRDVYLGRRALSPDIAHELALENAGHERVMLESLSTREFEILRMLAEAKSRNEISDTLNISPKTVSNCHYLIKRKLGVDSDIELTRFAIRMDVISISEVSGPLPLLEK